MTYTVHPAAEQDMADASDFHKERASVEVARRFLAEIDRVAGTPRGSKPGRWRAPHKRPQRIFI